MDGLDAVIEFLGYHESKPTVVPCICGSRRISTRFNAPSRVHTQGGGVRVYEPRCRKCSKCGFEGGFGSNESESRDNWNKAVKEAKNEGDRRRQA